MKKFFALFLIVCSLALSACSVSQTQSGGEAQNVNKPTESTTTTNSNQ